MNGGLGRAVEIVTGGAELGGHARQERRRQRFAAGEDQAEAWGRCAGGLVEKDLEERGHEVDDGDAGGGEQAPQIGRVAVAVGPREDEAGAAGERPGELPGRDVEPERRLLEHGIGGGERIGAAHPRDRLTSPRCGTRTPFGVPVEPEV